MEHCDKKYQQRRRKAQKKAIKKERRERLLEKSNNIYSPIIVPPQPKPSEPLPEPDTYEKSRSYCVLQ